MYHIITLIIIVKVLKPLFTRKQRKIVFSYVWSSLIIINARVPTPVESVSFREHITSTIEPTRTRTRVSGQAKFRRNTHTHHCRQTRQEAGKKHRIDPATCGTLSSVQFICLSSSESEPHTSTHIRCVRYARTFLDAMMLCVCDYDMSNVGHDVKHHLKHTTRTSTWARNMDGSFRSTVVR